MENNNMKFERENLKVGEVDWSNEGVIYMALNDQDENPYTNPYLVPYVEASLLIKKHYPKTSMSEIVKKEFLEGGKTQMNSALGATELEIHFDVDAVLIRAQETYQTFLRSGVVQKKGELCNRFGRVDKREIKEEIDRLQREYSNNPQIKAKEEIKELREENKELKKELRTQNERFEEYLEDVKRFMAEEFKKEGVKGYKRELSKGIKENKKMLFEDFKEQEKRRR